MSLIAMQVQDRILARLSLHYHGKDTRCVERRILEVKQISSNSKLDR